MKRKTDVEVTINNRKYVICGYESPEYIERIAAHINKKMDELKSQEWYKSLDKELKTVLLDINLVDDYFKANDCIKIMESERSQSNDEFFEMKHEVVKRQTEYDKLNASYEELEKKYNEAQKRIVELTTKLNVMKTNEM